MDNDKKIPFNIIKVKLTDEEKMNRIREYEEFEGKLSKKEKDEFMKKDLYNEFIEMKCLKCGYEETPEADIVLELFEMYNDPYPIFTCPNCDKDFFVPKDVYMVKKKIK